MHDAVYEEVFRGGTVTPERIETYFLRIMDYAKGDKLKIEEEADRFVFDLLHALEDGLVVKPEACATRYFEMLRKAKGEPNPGRELLNRVRSKSNSQRPN